jgi:NAD(P)-dependent dehydrogenase (short-subunit alcohol dehydrogenase family)
MDLRLTGKRAIVTGGSMGIGRAVADALLREGASVVIAARGRDALEATASELGGNTGGRVVPIVADTASDDSVKAMVNEAVRVLGGVDILVNSAAQPGGQKPPPKLAEIDDEMFWSDVNVKVMGYLRCIREVAPHMARGGGGRIINISGLAARSTGSTIGSIRNVSVAALTKNVADELAGQGITAVVVHPGLVATEKTPPDASAPPRSLLGRRVDAAEVAFVVAFLASPRAVVINGDAIVVGGGERGPIHY